MLAELEQVRVEPMTRPAADRTLGLLSRVQSVAASLMCDVTAVLAASGSETDPAEVLRRKARLGGRESKRMAKIARQLAEMPKVRDRLASGDITVGHVNALANAAEKVGPEAVEADPSLLEAAGRLLPDSFDRHARDWSNRKLIEAGVDPLERQRRAREAKLWVEKETGLGVLLAKLPTFQYQHVQQAIDGHYMQLLRRDGSDDQDPDQVRTPKQRLADVVYELLTNRDSVTGKFIDGTVDVKAKASTQVVITVPLGVVDGTDPDGHCGIVGAGPVPRRVLETLSQDTELVGMIIDGKGRPLWLGRKQRLANAPQRLAVAIRDGGCFECGAPMHQCDLHHIQPWRDGGRTDVDNLVAVCPRHHKWLEAQNLQVKRIGGRWQALPRDGPR